MDKFKLLKQEFQNTKIKFGKDIAINPYSTGVIPALLGVFIYAKFGEKIEDPNRVIDWVSV